MQLRHLFPVWKASILHNLCISILLRVTDSGTRCTLCGTSDRIVPVRVWWHSQNDPLPHRVQHGSIGAKKQQGIHPVGRHLLLWSAGCRGKSFWKWPNGNFHLCHSGNSSVHLRKQSKRALWNPSRNICEVESEGEATSGCFCKCQIITGMKFPHLDTFLYKLLELCGGLAWMPQLQEWECKTSNLSPKAQPNWNHEVPLMVH